MIKFDNLYSFNFGNKVEINKFYGIYEKNFKISGTVNQESDFKIK